MAIGSGSYVRVTEPDVSKPEKDAIVENTNSLKMTEEPVKSLDEVPAESAYDNIVADSNDEEDEDDEDNFEDDEDDDEYEDEDDEDDEDN